MRDKAAFLSLNWYLNNMKPYDSVFHHCVAMANASSCSLLKLLNLSPSSVWWRRKLSSRHYYSKWWNDDHQFNMSSKSQWGHGIASIKFVGGEERRDTWKSLHLIWLVWIFFVTSTPPGPHTLSYMKNFMGTVVQVMLVNHTFSVETQLIGFHHIWRKPLVI
jgi:hypothetical protein